MLVAKNSRKRSCRRSPAAAISAGTTCAVEERTSWLIRCRPPAVIVHRVVRAVARGRSEANGSAQDVVGRLIAQLVMAYPEGSDPRSWPLCAKLTPHLLALRGACPDAASDIAGWSVLLNRAGSYFFGRGAYSEAAPFLREGLAIDEKAFGPDHPTTATALNNLGLVLMEKGDLAAARPLFERALAIDEKARGPEHPSTATSLTNLASLLHDQGDLAGARS